jgi:hypothetical protein
MFMAVTLICTHLFRQIQFQFPWNFLMSHVTDSSISSSLSWKFHLWSSKSTFMLLSYLKFTSITARRTNVLYFSVQYKKTYKTKMNFIRELVQYQFQWWASMTAVISIHYSETTFLFITVYITAHSYSHLIVHHLFSFKRSTKVIHQRI